ncbi:MAG: leucine-rich repeat protein, partial [Solobacterium sp.]|nr:leucine-rich repeat protein [Solobacterium sp.]
DAQGKVTAVKATDKPVTVTVRTEDGSHTATCAVTVTAKVINVESVSLNKTELSKVEGETETLVATVVPENATNRNVTWTSSDPEYVTVDAQGKVTAVKATDKPVTVTVTTEDGSYTATCEVTVTTAEHVSDEWLKAFLYTVNEEEGTVTLNTLDSKNVVEDIVVYNHANIDGKEYQVVLTPHSFHDENHKHVGGEDTGGGTIGENYTTKSITFAEKIKLPSSPISIFEGLHELTYLDIRKADTTGLTDMDNMFIACESLKSLDLSGFDTSSVTSMSGMFTWCKSLTDVDLSSFDTSNVTYMGGMFASCESLTSVDVSGFDTSKVQYMESMFGNCRSLTELDLSSFDTSKVWLMHNMFYNCSSLKTLDISSFDLSRVRESKNIKDFLSKTSSLSELKAPAAYGNNVIPLTKTMYYLKDGKAVSTDSISSEVGSKTYLVTDLSKLVVTDELELNSYEETLIPGQTFELDAIFENDDAVPTDLVFTSSDTAVASVNANGVITANGGGDAVILVSSASHSASAECLVHVDDTYYDFKIAFDTGLDDEEIEHGRIVIRKYIGSDAEVGIPEEINGYPVEFIDYEAFKDNKTLVKVVVPSTVTDIYRNAFEGCTSLNEVYLNEGIRYIDDQAFKGCASLTDFVFPSTFESAGEKLFEGCTALEVIMLNDNLETISKGMFAGMKSAVEISVPASVKVIEENAFADSDIVSIEFEGDDIETIGAYAFRNCNNLEVLHVPSVEVIPAGFFSGTGLKEVSIPESVKEIKETAFQGAVSLQTVRYAGNKEGWDEISIGSENDPLLNAYLICEDGLVPVQSITLLPEEIWIKEGSSFAIETEFSPAQTTYQDVIWEFDEEHLTYEDGIFTAAKKGSYEGTITAVSAENKDISAECSVRIVGDDELYPLTPHMIKLPVGASFQMEMYDPNSLLDSTYVSWESSDEELAVVDDHGLVTVKGYGVLKITLTVHDEITYSWDVWTENQCSIYNGFVYSGSTILGYVGTDTDVTVPSVINGATITSIAQIAFDSNERLVSVTVPDTVKNIGMGAFESCPNLRTVKLPEGLTELQQGLFMYCSSLKKIDLPDSLTEIGPAAFSDSGLTEIDIPESVESIGMSAFAGCTELEKVTIHSGLARIASYAFRGCNKVTELDLPLSLTKIGDAVFGDYDNTMTVNYAGSRADWNNIKIGYDNESWLKNIVCAIRGITIEPIDSMVYTGSALKPKVTIYDDGALLKAGTHYTVTYKNNTKAASKDSETPPTVIIKMRGNYSGTETRTFDILPRDITQDEVTIISANYTGTVQKVSPTITDNKKTLKKNIDYTLSYPSAGDYKEPGKYEVIATGTGNYTGTRKFELQIASADQVNLSKTTITIPKSSYPYNNGAAIEPAVTVKSGRVVVDPGRYTVTYTNNTQCGTATVTVEGDGIYSVGTKSKTFKITGTALSKAIAASAVKKTIERNETPEILVKNKASFNLVEGKDYEIEYPDTSKAGKLYVLVNGINGYTGTVKVAITVNKDSLAKTATLTVADTVHVKSGAKPEVTVKATDGTILVEGVDYTVKYANNKKAAEKTAAKAPTVTVTGIGNYTGTLTAKFSIAVKELTNSMVEYAADINATTKKGAFTTTLVIKDVDGKALTANTDYDMKNAVYTRDDVVLTKLDTVNAGDVITVTVNGKGNYNGTVSAQFRVTEKVNNISSASVKIADKQYLNGTPVTLDEKDFTSAVLNKEPLTYGVDYEIADIKYPYTNNTKKGTATVRIHGIGKYAGYATVKFKIVARAIQENLVP